MFYSCQKESFRIVLQHFGDRGVEKITNFDTLTIIIKTYNQNHDRVTSIQDI